MNNTILVYDLSNDNSAFNNFVRKSMIRYISCDWGDLCKDDSKMNDYAVNSGEDRIMGSYENKEHPDWKIWIVTECDHSFTTILFPHEY